MGGSGKSVYYVDDYYMTVHFGICHGPVDSLNRIVIKEKEVWKGRLTANDTISVDLPELFGGAKKEGGVAGLIEFYTGAYDQVMSPAVASRVGRTPTTMPGYRGLANLFFRGNGAGGFKWTANNPYMPGTWAGVTALPRSLSDEFAAIYEVDPGFSFEGDPIEVPFTLDDLGVWKTLDLVAMGIPIESIDNPPDPDYPETGTGTLRMSWDATYPGPLTAITRNTVFEFYSGPPSPETLIYDGLLTNPAVNDPPIYTHYANITIPVGTRFIRVKGEAYEPFIPAPATFVSSSQANFVSYLAGAVNPTTLPDANPAHMIYECLVNTLWGRGVSPSLIDTASFMAAAATLSSEKFGLSIQWTQQAMIEQYIEEILDHIQAALFANPRTGLLELKLFRFDYDIDTLPILTPSNSRVEKFQRKTWSETINEITVSWTNPENEQEETLSYQDDANYAIQGEIVPETRNYYGIRNRALAARVCARDSQSAAQPLATATLRASRAFWEVNPGTVLKMQSPEDNVSLLVVRVTKVERTRAGTMPLVLTVMEEIFGQEVTVFETPTGSQWGGEGTPPVASNASLEMTAPRSLALRAGLDATAENEPNVAAMLMVKRPAPSMTLFDLEGPDVLPNGDPSREIRGTFSTTPTSFTGALLPREESTVMTLAQIWSVAGDAINPSPSDLLVVGSSEALHEIVMFDSFDSLTEEWTLARGMFDTVPQEWAANTGVWHLSANFDAIDTSEMPYLSTVDYRYLTKTGSARLSPADAPLITATLTERPYQPIRPGAARMDGELWAPIFVDPGVNITCTWETRNRFSEDSIFPRYLDTSYTPEVGQTTEIVLKDLAGTEITAITGLTGTSHTFDPDAATSSLHDQFYVEIHAERDGLRSLQASPHLVTILFLGYGRNYGFGYGIN
jgi:Putative phage tail protein